MPKKYITVTVAAKILKMGVSGVRQRADDKVLKGYKESDLSGREIWHLEIESVNKLKAKRDLAPEIREANRLKYLENVNRAARKETKRKQAAIAVIDKKGDKRLRRWGLAHLDS